MGRGTMDSNDSAAVSTYTLGCAYMSAIIDSNCGHPACITKRRSRLWRSNTSSNSIGSPNAIRYAGDLYGVVLSFYQVCLFVPFLARPQIFFTSKNGEDRGTASA